MNKYKLKIVQEDGMYVGYALQNDEVAFKTNPCKDSITASRSLSILIGKSHSPSLPQISAQRTVGTKSAYKAPSAPISHTAASAPLPVAPRKCCGRG
jgi:hypothetical protein